MTKQNSHGQWNKTFVQVHAQKSVTPIDVCYLLVYLTDVVKSGETFIDGLIRGGGYQVPGLFTHGAFRNTSYPSGQCKIVLTQGIAVCKGLQCSRVRHEGHLQMAMFQH